MAQDSRLAGHHELQLFAVRVHHRHLGQGLPAVTDDSLAGDDPVEDLVEDDRIAGLNVDLVMDAAEERFVGQIRGIEVGGEDHQ